MNNTIYLIYQPGKVGSTSVYRALLREKIPAIQTHVINYNRKFGASHRNDQNRKFSEYYFLGLGYYLFYFIKYAHKKRFKVINLVRDPISRNISSFFQHSFIYLNKVDINSVDSKKLSQKFIHELYDHWDMQKWYDLELKKVFDFDIYQHKFDKYNGYSIYKLNNCEILILQLEKLNRIGEEILKNYLKIRNIEIKKENTSTEKKYSKIKEKFIKNLILPFNYCEKMYDSKFTTHFYSTEQINQFKKKWCFKGK